MRDGLSNKPSQAAAGHGGAGGRPGSWNCPLSFSAPQMQTEKPQGPWSDAMLGEDIKKQKPKQQNSV